MRFSKWICCLLMATAAVAADQDAKDADRRVFRLEWRDLDRMIRGKNIDITLPSGIHLKGRVASVDADGLSLEVRKTSNKRAYPKGRAILPRPEVTQFRLARKEGHRWSAIGVGIGGGIGSLVAMGVAQFEGTNAQKAGAAALAVGIPAALGYGLGWAADHETVDIIVVPDGSGPARK